MREGALTERDTRVYQGLTAVQQRSLHRSRMAGDLNAGEVRQIARLLREAPDMTVASASRLLMAAVEEPEDATALTADPTSPAATAPRDEPRGGDFTIDTLRPARVGAPTNIERLDWVRGHLARVDRHNLSAAERKEMLRLLKLIADDVASLTSALRGGE